MTWHETTVAETLSDVSTVADEVSAEQVGCAWQQFVRFLKAGGARITQSRRIVLEAALRRQDHFRADELAGVLVSGANRVSRGTVYRTLALLVRAGMVREIRDADTHTHYEAVFAREWHEHMICDRCGRFIEFTDAGLAEHIEKACQQQGFTWRVHRVEVFGLCQGCARSAT